MPANPPPETKKVSRTIDQPVTAIQLVKPGELVDVVEMTPLTLADRRIYNLLLAHAWEKIDEPITHVIAKKSLRGSHNVNDRIGDSIERLMAAIVRVEIDKDGKTYTRRFQLIAGTDEAQDPDGMLYYNFDAGMRALIRNSKIFAVIKKDVMFALTSKYALALYEMVQKRGNLKFKFHEDFELERFRDLLGVERDKLLKFYNLNQWAIKPALLEVSALSDFGCDIKPLLEGRRVVGVRLAWWKKDEEGLKATFRELQYSKVGRRARIKGTAETVTAVAALPAQDGAETGTGMLGNYPQTSAAHAGMMKKLHHMFPNYDIEHFEREFQKWLLIGNRSCDNYEAALIGFIRKIVEGFKPSD
jgi:hypothetical protein